MIGTRAPELPAAVLFDFSGTLFAIESAADSVRAALGQDNVSWAPRLAELGAINGSTNSVGMPDHLADVWERRDLSPEAHRAAYSGLSVHAGLTEQQAAALYDRGVRPEAWHPYPDTVRTLHRLNEYAVPVAVVSNIGWDPRPVLDGYRVSDCIDLLVLSDERGVLKPDPEIFRQACAGLGVPPERCLMVGDNREVDGAATKLGIRFAFVDARRSDDALLRAVGLA